MSTDYIMDMSREVVWTIVRISAPLLIISLVIGLIISIFQTITSIQEQTLTFVPKFVAIMIVLLLFGGWMMNGMADLLTSILSDIPELIKR